MSEVDVNEDGKIEMLQGVYLPREGEKSPLGRAEMKRGLCGSWRLVLEDGIDGGWVRLDRRQWERLKNAQGLIDRWFEQMEEKEG